MVRGIRIGDHSWSDIGQGTTNPTIATSDYTWYKILAGALNLGVEKIFNHSAAGAQLCNANYGLCSWATMLNAILSTKSQSQAYPAVEYGELLILGFTINDLAKALPTDIAKIVADMTRCKRSILRAHRAAAWFPCQGSGQWAFGANFSNSTDVDNTIGTAKVASVVDSAGTSTATYTIPSGYQGETITFYMNALSGGSLIVTWGGTVTGTTGTTIVGRTDTLSNLTLKAQCSYPVVFTAAATGLSALNAGQTITVRITTVSASNFTIEGATIEASEPAPAILYTFPRLPEKNISWQFGDGVLNSTTTLTSPTAAQFVSANDAGGAIVVSDGGGGIPGGTTVSSVTNLTTLVMSAAATATRSNVKITLTRHIKGYSGIGSPTNTNFSGATVASHSAADADVDSANTALVALATEFGKKVVVCDLAAQFNSDANPPAGQYSWFEAGGLHLNELGQRQQAKLTLDSIGQLANESTINDGPFQGAIAPSRQFGTFFWPTRNNNIITTPYAAYGATYTAVVGDVFAQWVYIGDPTTNFTNLGVEQTNAPATSGSTLRWSIFSDVNVLGYPDALVGDFGTLALGTTTGMKTQAAAHVARAGWYWLVFRVDVLGTTASQLRTAIGPQPFGPLGTWIAAGGASPVAPMGYKLTGQSVGSAFPNRFYLTGASVVATVPLIAATVTRVT